MLFSLSGNAYACMNLLATGNWLSVDEAKPGTHWGNKLDEVMNWHETWWRGDRCILNGLLKHPTAWHLFEQCIIDESLLMHSTQC